MAVVKHELSNGFEVLMDRRKGSPVSAFSVGFKQGKGIESKELNGSTHFLEHILLKHSKKHRDKRPEKIISLKGGRTNGHTSFMRMCLDGAVLSQNIDFLVDLESNLISNPSFNKKDIEEEKGIILQELNIARGKNLKKEVLFKNIIPSYSFSNTLGFKDDISIMSFVKLRKRLKQLRISNGMQAVVVGDFNEKKILSILEDNFNGLKKGKIKKNKIRTKKAGDYSSIYKRIKKPEIYMGFKIPFHKTDFNKLFILRSYLHLVFKEELRHKRSLIYSLFGFSQSIFNGKYYLSGSSIDENKLDLAKKIMAREVKKIKERKVKNSFLTIAKNNTKFKVLSDNLDIEKTRVNLEYYNTIGLLDSFKKRKEIIESVNEKELIDLANKYLSEDKLYWITLTPK